MSNHYDKKIEQLQEQDVANTFDLLDLWVQHDLFSARWWFGVAMTILPWILWLIQRRKESTYRLLLVGLFVIMITSSFDFIGDNLGLWYYRHEVIPFIPGYLPWDSSLFPVIIMLLIQYKPSFHPLWKALIFATLTSFVGEPLMVWLDFYVKVKWEYIYSFPIYILIYLAAHWVSRRTAFAPLDSTS